MDKWGWYQRHEAAMAWAKLTALLAIQVIVGVMVISYVAGRS